MDYFSVKKFEEFQHYKDRSPPWIKFYNTLLHDFDHSTLPDAAKSHLHAIWLLASCSSNRIPWEPKWIAGQIGATEKIDLELLERAGFIIKEQTCSNPLATRVQGACLETERETEREKKDIYTRNQEFEEWWNLWTIPGTKKAKGGSRRKYDTVRKTTDHAELCSGLTRYLQHCKQSGTPVSMIAHPKTWLNGGYWSNEYELDAVDDPPTHGGAMFEPDPVDYGFPSDSILVASAPMYWSFRLPDGTTKEVRR